MTDDKHWFTEDDQRKLMLLPEEEKNDFESRFCQIAMQKRMLDDKWLSDSEELEKVADQLIRDIHERLDKMGAGNG